MSSGHKVSYYFSLARKASQFSDHHTHKLGCIIVQKNRVVSVGFNQMKTNPRSPHPFKYLHAEIHALIGEPVCDTVRSVAYIYREHKDGSPALSKPCPSCELALRCAGVSKVIYTCKEGYKELEL